MSEKKEKKKQLLITIASKILKLPEKKLNLDSSPNSVENWDSLSHLELISAVEKEFKINISPEQSVDINNIGDLLKIIDH